jgi:hypothetical protein
MNEQTQTMPAEPGPPVPPGAADTAGRDTIITSLLKSPQAVSHVIAGREALLRSALLFLGTGIVCHAVFGFAAGMFGGLQVAWMDVAKAPLVAVCSLFLCFPSLYVFACVAGSPLTFSQTFTLGCSCLAMLGLILIGLAPVAWLFAVSTESVPFMVMLLFLVWIIALSFTSRYVGTLRANPLFQRQGGIKLWFFILILVTLQMTTCMRPMLAKPENGWWTPGKTFFLSHFGSTFDID